MTWPLKVIDHYSLKIFGLTEVSVVAVLFPVPVFEELGFLGVIKWDVDGHHALLWGTPFLVEGETVVHSGDYLLFAVEENVVGEALQVTLGDHVCQEMVAELHVVQFGETTRHFVFFGSQGYAE